MTTDTPAPRRALAAAIRARHAAVVAALRDGTMTGHPRVNRFDDEPGQFSARIAHWLDLFVAFLDGEAGMRAIFAGQTGLELTYPDRSADENRAGILAALADVEAELAGALDPAQAAALHAAFAEATAGLRQPPVTHVRTLLIGDCLMGEIASLATDDLARRGITFDVFPLNARDAAQLDRPVQSLATGKVQAVFFSPFSHARLAEIEALLAPRAARYGRVAIDQLVDSIIAQTGAILAYLRARFDCPIYVHNAALVARGSGRASVLLRNTLTARTRHRARTRLNRWLVDWIAAQPDAATPRVHLIDEAGIAGRLGWRSGQYLSRSEYFHATPLSMALASDYAARLTMLAELADRKLVICDLDHTLWDGVIGEGKVAHFHDRQEILHRLRAQSGVVLSIASKNDPANVHFDGGTLSMNDFVAPQISWGPKVEAVRRIQQQLNLQFRHMIFIDDRPDEREQVKLAFPDMVVLDATDPAAWSALALWAEITHAASDMDRTQMYQEQVARDGFLGSGDGLAPDHAARERLGLEIAIRPAAKADLKRFAELVNRTNQWNMTGARLSKGQVDELYGASDHMLLLGSARDKFGDMGDVCAASVTVAGDTARIDHFVLSCRVFGYGVETAMIDEITRRLRARGNVDMLVGSYRATTQNGVSRAMYPDHAFAPTDEAGNFALTLVTQPPKAAAAAAAVSSPPAA